MKNENKKKQKPLTKDRDDFQMGSERGNRGVAE